MFRLFNERLAATYSRGSYTTTTIGLAVFDGRVRNGNGSDHCGNATKVGRPRYLPCKIIDLLKNDPKRFGDSLKTTHRGGKAGRTIRELKLFFL